MNIQIAGNEYVQAQRQAQKEYRESLMAGQHPHPLILDDLLPDGAGTVLNVGTLEIPAERIIGVKSAGRISAFTRSFKPLLDQRTEFASKWMNLCMAHMSDAGITDPIECYEYLGNFYVQEGNKRVSVLRYFGATRIPANVKRIMPPMSDNARIHAYYEFLEFYKTSKAYALQFRRPGDYAKLLSHLGKKPSEEWTDDERRTLNAYYHYFTAAFHSLANGTEDVLPEEALLLWLDLYPYQDLGRMSSNQLKKSLAEIWEDVLSINNQDAVQMQTKAEDSTKTNFIGRLTATDHVNVAFVHQLDDIKSTWVLGHEEGRAHIEEVFGDKITVRSYFDANTPEEAEAAIEQAVAEGAHVVFTTSPPMSRATLKAAVKHPKVRFLNCSVDQAYSSIRTYYGRMYEAKFITGAIAGAMAGDDRIGYITSYPIFGVPASINAFALGAQMTNPRAQIELRWSCLPGNPSEEFIADGIRVVSNRSTPTPAKGFLEFCSYGTYLMDSMGEMVPLGSPVWAWGKFYEFVIRSIFAGGWKQEKGMPAALNYWLGMDSGIIGMNLSDKLPEGVRQMAKILEKGICDGTIDPFHRRIVAQDGSVKNNGSYRFSPTEILHMDWLCENVIGTIPSFEELLPSAQPLVRELGIYRDKIVPEMEVKPREDFDRSR